MFAFQMILMTTPADEAEIEKRFYAVNRLHNKFVSYCIPRLKALWQDKEYAKLLDEYRELKKDFDAKESALKDKGISASESKQRRKECAEAKAKLDECTGCLNVVREAHGLSKTQLEAYGKVWQARHSHLVTSQQAQAEADRVWKGVAKILFSTGKKLHYRKIRDMNTIGGKSNKNGARFFAPDATHKYPYITWLGLEIGCKARWKNKYVRAALHMDSGWDIPLSYCQIKRQAFPDGWHYYVILTFKEASPAKKRKIGDSTMGVDPGVSSFAGVSKTKCFLEELAPKAKEFNQRIARLQRKMNRSDRLSNPENYNPDGTAKPRGAQKKRTNSKTYQKNLWKLRTEYRRKSAYIKQEHNRLANRILEDSSHFIVEKNDFAAMAKRAKGKAEREETAAEVKAKDGTVKEVRKFKKKKRFGKSMSDRSPSLFLRILKEKCQAAGGVWEEADPKKLKGSQYRHDTDTYEKVPLSQRMKVIDGHEVQRDLYSAFLYSNTDASQARPDQGRCKEAFDDFCRMQDELIAEMKQSGISMRQCFGF